MTNLKTVLKIMTFGAIALTLSGCIIAIGDDWDDHNNVNVTTDIDFEASTDAEKTSVETIVKDK